MRNGDDMRDNGSAQGRRKPNLKLWLLGALGVYLVAFVLLNDDPVDVNFLFFKARDIGLVWVMLVVAVIAGVIAGIAGWLVGRDGRGRKEKAKD